jgi:hypothetical protein
MARHSSLALRVLLCCSLVAVLLISAFPTPRARAAAALELYGTFHAMGVIVTIGSGDDPNQNATASVSYRISGGSYQPGFPLTRISSTRFVGSLFWLQPGTSYDVQVTFADPDTGPLNGTMVQSTASTRTEITLPTPSKTYYVTPTGSGTTCSLASPCTLSSAINQAQAGQAIALRGGTYYQVNSRCRAPDRADHRSCCAAIPAKWPSSMVPIQRRSRGRRKAAACIAPPLMWVIRIWC